MRSKTVEIKYIFSFKKYWFTRSQCQSACDTAPSSGHYEELKRCGDRLLINDVCHFNHAGVLFRRELKLYSHITLRYEEKYSFCK